MQIDDTVLLAPPIGIAAGLASYFAFGASVSTSILVASAIGLAPIALMAILAVIMIVVFGGFSNDRPPCSCGSCNSSDYVYDDVLTRERNPNQQVVEWCYRCPKCDRQWIARYNIYYELSGDSLIAYRKRNRWGRWVGVQ